MSIEFTQTTADDIDPLRIFLKTVFRVRDGEPLIDPAQMRWKFHEARPDWPESRSFVLIQDGLIIAHSSIVPVTFLTSHGKITSLNPLDWGASQVGAGVQLLRRLHGLADTCLGLDAAPATYDILGKLRYRPVGHLEIYSRVVRPFSAFRRDVPRGAARATLKLVRNAALSVLRARVPGGWSAVPVSRFDDAVQEVLPRAGALQFTPTERSAGALNYMLRCPVATFSGLLLYHRARLRGYALLSRVGGQSRIADLHVDSGDPGDWDIAVALVTRAAVEDPRVHEVLAGAAAPFVQASIRRSGFRCISREPILLHDPKNMFENVEPPNVSLIDDDMAYL